MVNCGVWQFVAARNLRLPEEEKVKFPFTLTVVDTMSSATVGWLVGLLVGLVVG